MHLKTSLLKAGVLSLLLAVAMPALGQRIFAEPTDRDGTVPVDKAPTVVRAMNVLIDTGQLAAKSRTLRMFIFDNKTLDLELDRTEPIPGRGLVWYGKVSKEPRSSAVLTLVGETVSGNIDTEAGKVYQIRYVGGGVHSFREIDRTKFPDEGTPLRGSIKPGPTLFADIGPCADPPTDIDAMVVYTPAARMAAGGKDAMEGLVYLAVADTNESYLNSDINQRLRLAHVEEVSYTETGASLTDVKRLQNGSDGFLDNVQTLRDTFAADTVTLITETLDFCGQGYFMRTVDHSFESFAYSVVRRDCLTGYFSLAHELGHNMGADHDLANEMGGGTYPYNHGFINTSPTAPVKPWHTIMANQAPPSTRVKYWSNPSVSDAGGDPMGNAATADNHRVLNNTALTVANFRCSSPSAGNVWMKDTWDDTGLEPDSHTAGEDMWKSPYIWVRNTQDNALVHQHEHQNPVFGAPNWVYVKMHNGGSTDATGNLEVYWANASISLTWQGGWTLLSSTPVTGFTSHSARVVEVPWNNLPGTGHYCMIARWNSAADPMATAEGRDINANVRANNNLAWRNLHIVDLMAGASAEAMLNVMNPDDGNEAISIVIRSSSLRGSSSFLAAGQVLVEFDETLRKAWQDGGARGSGFRTDGNRLVIGDSGATFENLILPFPRGGRLKMIFRRLPATPKREYLVDVEQRRPAQFAAAQTLSVVGGVSYEIHTDRDYIQR